MSCFQRTDVSSPPAQTFDDCAALRLISIPKTVRTLDFASFEQSGLENIIFDAKSLQSDRMNLDFIANH